METDLSDIAVSRSNGSMKVMGNNTQRNGNYNDVTLLIYDKTLDVVADAAAFNNDGVMFR